MNFLCCIIVDGLGGTGETPCFFALLGSAVSCESESDLSDFGHRVHGRLLKLFPPRRVGFQRVHGSHPTGPKAVHSSFSSIEAACLHHTCDCLGKTSQSSTHLSSSTRTESKAPHGNTTRRTLRSWCLTLRRGSTSAPGSDRSLAREVEQPTL